VNERLRRSLALFYAAIADLEGDELDHYLEEGIALLPLAEETP
jgi:hypothetical protein